MNSDIIGARIGIYDVLYECKERASDGHKLYRVKCIHCGREFDMLKAQIDRAKQCRHIGLGDIYIHQLHPILIGKTKDCVVFSKI